MVNPADFPLHQAPESLNAIGVNIAYDVDLGSMIYSPNNILLPAWQLRGNDMDLPGEEPPSPLDRLNDVKLYSCQL